MNKDTYMLYDPTLGRMIAVGSKEQITSIAEEYMEALRFTYEIQQAQKKKVEMRNGMV